MNHLLKYFLVLLFCLFSFFRYTAVLHTAYGVTIGTDTSAVTTETTADSDADGISNSAEGENLTDETASTDSDDDSVPDYLESNTTDTDGDGLTNDVDANDDGDGTTTIEENNTGSSVTISNSDETIFPDADADSVPDYLESDIVDTDHDGIVDSADPDDDGDSIATIQEGTSTETNNPIGDAVLTDTDHDGTPDYLDTNDDGDTLETIDEASSDSDADSIPDYLESNIIDTDKDGIVNSLDNDDDGDGVPTINDGTIVGGSFYKVLEDVDHDGLPDYIDPDDDNDGILTINEDINHDGNVENDDVDNDSVPDFLESNTADADKDGLTDNLDADDDGDGVLTAEEVQAIGEGEVIFPDTDHDNIPNYLDSDSTTSLSGNKKTNVANIASKKKTIGGISLLLLVLGMIGYWKYKQRLTKKTSLKKNKKVKKK